MTDRRAFVGFLATVAALGVPGTAAAVPIATFAKCGPSAAANARCGTVAVPLDRANPASPAIAIAFQLTPHTDQSAPAASAIVTSNGGPGLSNIISDPIWRDRLAPLLATHDLLAIDHRGIGQSAAIDCPALQHVRGNQIDAARSCGASLGAASDRYGSGDVADDVDDVRAALGIDKIDYYGVSYGAVDVRAYAYRHADHLRAAVLDSPDSSTDDAFFRTLPGAMAKIAARVCERSTACSAGEAHPAATLSRLVRRLRARPVVGTGYDASGTARRLRVDERGLLGILYDNYFSDPAFLNQGEVFAAARALRAGDSIPLLRLAAESRAPTDFGDANGAMSVGADYAVFCADSVFPWDKSAPEATRRAQYLAAVKALPASSTAPFSVSAWTGFVASQPVLLIPGADACTPWPAPTRPEPPFPPGQPFPAGVPALLFGGGLDYLDVSQERTLLPLFTNARFVTVANGGHVTTLWSRCAAGIAVRFLSTLQPGNTSCAADVRGPSGNPFGGATGKLQIQGVGRFALRAGDAIPAKRDRARRDASTPLARRVAAVGWAAVEDAVYQTPRLAATTGRGLRGGTFKVKHGKATTTITYRRVRFSRDVAVSGVASLDVASSRLTGRITVAGPVSGTLRLGATLWNPDRPNATLRGTLGGRRVALVAPAR
jgi:pimeloyl-ACP methyl ester carboxylesterase